MRVEYNGAIHDFPDDFSDDDISAALAGPSTTETVVDVGKSLGTGAVKGVLGLANTPHFINDVLNAGNTILADRFPNYVQRRDTTPLSLPTAEGIQKNIESVTGEFYKPQTYAGEWGETIGGFLPAAATGPGSLGVRLVTQAMAPALASEGAGYVTKGSSIETPARIAAAILSGPAAARTIGAGRAPVGPAIEDLKAEYRSVVKDPAIKSIPVSQADATGLGVRVVDKLDAEDFDPLNAPLPYKRAEYIADMTDPTVGAIHKVRKKLSKDAQSKVMSNPAETEAAGVARREIDDFLDAYDPRLKEANANYAAAKRAELVDAKRVRAELRSEAANSGQNISNATRQRMVDILTDKKLKRGFSQDELEQMERVVRGTATGNAARYVGNFLGGGGGFGQATTSLGLGGAGFAATGSPLGMLAAVPSLVLGPAAKSVEAASTARQMRLLDQMVRMRSPLGQNTSLPVMDPAREAIVRAMLQSSAATNASR